MKVNGYELKPRARLEGADLQGVDLAGIDLEGANLYRANLRGAYLEGANFKDAILWETNLQDTNLRDAYFKDSFLLDADFQGASLQDASFEGARANAYFCESDLRGACFNNADIRGVDFGDSFFEYVNLWGAKISRAKNIPEKILKEFDLVSPKGDVIGWKKCVGGVIVKLLIKDGTPRSNGTTNACRAKEITVLEVLNGSIGLPSFLGYPEYRKGYTISSRKWEEDRWQENSGGIYFFMTKQEAESNSMNLVDI